MSTTNEVAQKLNQDAQTPAVQSQPRTILGHLKSDAFKATLAKALPRHLTADRMTRIVMTELRKNKELARCSQESFFGAVLQAGQLGLEPGSALGHCYLLPYKENCQLIIGYKGMIELARRSGQIVSIFAYCVHQKDEFTYELGINPTIKHKPADVADRGPLTYAYAVAHLKDGGFQFEVMSRAEIESIRTSSRAGKSGPWVSHFDEMAKKTVIRRLFKMLPVSVEAARAVDVDEMSDRGEVVNERDFIDADFEVSEPAQLEQ